MNNGEWKKGRKKSRALKRRRKGVTYMYKHRKIWKRVHVCQPNVGIRGILYVSIASPH